MYTPASFELTDITEIQTHIEQHSFATLVSYENDEPLASHLPLLLDRSSAPCGQLLGHMAKANSQWKSADGNRVLAVFHGPHAYISPAWYQDQNVVPTWNYTAVHAYGTFRVVDDAEHSLRIVRQYVDIYEAQMPTPWSSDSTEAGFVESLLGGIVSFTIDVDRLEGKQKLSQNHSADRQAGVIQGLRDRNRPGDQDIANLMAENNKPG